MENAATGHNIPGFTMQTIGVREWVIEKRRKRWTLARYKESPGARGQYLRPYCPKCCPSTVRGLAIGQSPVNSGKRAYPWTGARFAGSFRPTQGQDLDENRAQRAFDTILTLGIQTGARKTV